MSGSSDYTRTPNLALYKPISSRAVGTWGDLWNSNADALDSAIHFASGGGPFLPLAGGTVFGPLNWTSTGSTTSRSAQDRSADVANVLDYGADPTGVTDSAPAFQAALATGHNVWAPAGTYLITRQLVMAGKSQSLRGDGMDTLLTIDTRFDPTVTTGVILVTGSWMIEISDPGVSVRATARSDKNGIGCVGRRNQYDHCQQCDGHRDGNDRAPIGRSVRTPSLSPTYRTGHALRQSPV